MTQINLLPWRDKHILYKNRIFGAIAAAIFLAAFGIQFLISLIFSGYSVTQKNNVNILNTEINSVSNTMNRISSIQDQIKNRIAQQDVIIKLNKQRNLPTIIFNELNSSVPQEIILLELSKQDNVLMIKGISESHSAVSEFMRNLELVNWITSTQFKDFSSDENPQGNISFLIETTIGNI